MSDGAVVKNNGGGSSTAGTAAAPGGALALYQERILALAKSGAGVGEVAGGVRAKLTNPLCGDETEVSARIEDGVILAAAHRTRGCVLCRAAAAAMVQRAPGLSVAAARELVGDFSRMLNEGGPVVAGLEMFSPAAGRPSRRRCALLPFLALGEAAGGEG